MKRWHRTAVRGYSLLLVAFPAHHRARYANEMVEAFALELKARGTFRFALAALIDVVKAGVSLGVSEGPERAVAPCGLQDQQFVLRRL